MRHATFFVIPNNLEKLLLLHVVGFGYNPIMLRVEEPFQNEIELLVIFSAR